MPAKSKLEAIEMDTTEKNELLNNTDVKMRDFESIDSEDFLEEDNDLCSEKCSCLKQRTTLEKALCVFLVIAFCIIIGLLVNSSKKTVDKGSENVCSTDGCVRVASSLLSSMNTKVKPCDDFYKYACGGWEDTTPIPPGFSYWDKTQELAYSNLYQLHRIIDSSKDFKGALLKAKKFHDSCIGEDSMNRTYVKEIFQSLIQLISGAEQNYTFATVLERIHQLNTWPLFTVTVGPDEWHGDSNVIKISQSDMPYPLGVLINATTKDDDKYLEWNAQQVKDKYLKDMVSTLRMFWNKNETESKNLAEKLLKLDIELAKTRKTEDIILNRANVYKNTTIAEFQHNCSMIDWELYLTTLSYGTATVKNSDKIALLHEDKLVEVCNIVNSYKSSSETKSVLYYYLLTHAVRSFMPYFEVSHFKDYSEQTELNFDGELWRRCTFYTNKAFGFATAAAYVNGSGQTDNVELIEGFVQEVKEVFKDFVLRKVWFQGSVRNEANKKIDEMLNRISYPKDMLQLDFLDKFYEEFVVEDDWYENLKNWKKFDVSNMFTDLGKDANKKRWIRPPFIVEHDYDPLRNELHFPTAMLHLPFYTADGPATFNYGALASLIGHEITHAFDILGRQYNAKGKLEKWWDPFTIRSFNLTVSCMKDQYDRYKIDGFQVNGHSTLDENIADNGGLRAAFFAYQLWERKGASKKKLPGIDLDNRQLFFLSYAQMFCSKWRPDGLQKHIIDNKHSPGPIRVRGAITNMNTFADAFNCPIVSTYNPEKRCEVW